MIDLQYVGYCSNVAIYTIDIINFGVSMYMHKQSRDHNSEQNEPAIARNHSKVSCFV